MLKTSLKVLKQLENSGYEAYIIGGFVRDYIMGIDSLDVDIATNATPRQIKEVFKEVALPKEDYGSISLISKSFRFEITTFRKELSYHDNRKPKQIEYIDDLKIDLERRDFLMNTLCMNSKGEIIDYLGGRKDIDNKLINCVNDPIFKFYQDPLRILRAIRFATTLKFKLSKSTKNAIIKTAASLERLSFQRKREELDKIFSHPDAKIGIKLIKDLNLDKYLEIDISNVKLGGDLMGIWASIKASDKYPFNRNEKELIEKIRYLEDKDNLDEAILYKYGLYVNIISASLKGIDRAKVVKKYDKLVIKSPKDIKITTKEILKLLKNKDKTYLRDILNELEEKILDKSLKNETKDLVKYINDKYGET